MPTIQQISSKPGKPSISGVRINSSLFKLTYDSEILPVRQVVLWQMRPYFVHSIGNLS